MSDQDIKTSASDVSNLLEHPQQVKDLLSAIQQGTITLTYNNPQQSSSQEQNVAQGNFTMPQSRKRTNPDQYAAHNLYGSNASTDSVYGSKASANNVYGTEASADSLYGSKTPAGSTFGSSAGFYDAPKGGLDGGSGAQGYHESNRELGKGSAGVIYYEDGTFQEDHGDMGDQDYQNNQDFHGYGGSSQGAWDRASGTNTWAEGQGNFEQSYSGRDKMMRGRGRGERSRGRGRGEGSRGRGRGQWSQGQDDVSWGHGYGNRGQGSDGKTRGRGTRGHGFDGGSIRGRGSAYRGMSRGGGLVNGPAAKKPRWQNEQQGYGEAGSGEQRWGADQGWVRSKEGRGRGKEQRGRGRGSRGGRGGGGYPQQDKQPYDTSDIEYGFDGKLRGPERYSKTCREYKYCKVCNVRINSLENADDHYNGKPHMRKLNNLLQQEEMRKMLAVKDIPEKCELCDVKYTSVPQMKMHLDGAKHKRNLEERKDRESAGRVEEKKRLFISNIAPDANETSLKELLECVSVRVPLQKDTDEVKNKGVAIALFESQAAAQAAIDKFEGKDGLHLIFTKGRKDTQDTAPEVTKEKTCLYIKNIAPDANETSLKELLECVFVRVPLQKDTDEVKNKGIALAHFENQALAQSAIDKFEGKDGLHLEFARDKKDLKKAPKPKVQEGGETSSAAQGQISATEHSQGTPYKPQAVWKNNKLQGICNASRGRPKKLFNCDLCGISCNSAEILATHFVGKKHMKVMELFEKKNKNPHSGKNEYDLRHIEGEDAHNPNIHFTAL